MSDTILVYTTFERKEEALKLVKFLLKRRLIACAQIESSVDSMYWWDGKIEKAREIRLVMKSSLLLWKELERVIDKNHPYGVPEILAVPVAEVGEKYSNWLNKELR